MSGARSVSFCLALESSFFSTPFVDVESFGLEWFSLSHLVIWSGVLNRNDCASLELGMLSSSVAYGGLEDAKALVYGLGAASFEIHVK